jgi:hypothetical protein
LICISGQVNDSIFDGVETYRSVAAVSISSSYSAVSYVMCIQMFVLLPVAEDPEVIVIAKIFNRTFSHIELVVEDVVQQRAALDHLILYPGM